VATANEGERPVAASTVAIVEDVTDHPQSPITRIAQRTSLVQSLVSRTVDAIRQMAGVSGEQQRWIEAALEVLGDELLDRAPGLPPDRPAGRRRAQKWGRGRCARRAPKPSGKSGRQWPRPRRTMTPIPMSEPVTSFPQAALLAISITTTASCSICSQPRRGWAR
jgi:hypothetical protein